MPSPFASYVLCGTPRSGSTLLCGMLEASGVAGRPASFFRREDVADWARAWGLPQDLGPDAPGFDRAYLDAMRREGSAGTGMFGLRLMAGSLDEAARRLNRALGRDLGAVQALEAAFGPVLFVHLSRRDTVAQAVSLARAEQSGIWHRRADGSVLEGGAAARPTAYDRARIAALAGELRRDEAAWGAVFGSGSIRPLRLAYEDVAAEPRAALARVLDALGLDPGAARGVPVGTARLADADSRAWARRFREEGARRAARRLRRSPPGPPSRSS